MSSACGSPDKLKSVNEMERKLDTLEKENLTLRIRLFHQEDWWANSKPGQDLAKEIVDLKVQLATQKETIKEKTDAVVQASKALNYMESVLKKNDDEFNTLKKRIAELEGCLVCDQQDGTNDKTSELCATSPEGVNLSDLCKSDSSENPMLRVLEDENGALKKEVARLQNCVSEMCQKLDKLMNDSTNNGGAAPEKNVSADDSLKNLKADNEKLRQQLNETKKSLEGTAKNLECAKQQLMDEKRNAADLICENEELGEKLKKTEKGLRNATKIVEKVMSNSHTSKYSCDRSGDTCEDVSLNTSPPCAAVDKSGGDGDSLACEMRRIVREKNAELLELRGKMKCEGRSQEVIDKELCGRLDEVKRLTQVLAMHEQRVIAAAGSNASWDRTARTCDMTTLSSCSTGGGASAKQLKALEAELECSRKAVDEYEAKTGQMSNLVTVLRLRLEELAGFLKTLLQHKDILGFLCRERVSAIENAVDRSLNFTSAMDVSCGNVTIGDITNVSKLFGDFSLDATSCGNADGVAAADTSACQGKTATTVDALRNEILTLRGELDKAYKKKECEGRKERKSLPCRGANAASDEEWSGPDLNVSAQRIGIEVAKEKTILISSSEDEVCASATGKRCLMEKIMRYERELEARDNKVLEVKLVMVELETELKQEQVLSADLQRNFAQAKEANAKLEKEVCGLKKRLSDALVDLEEAQREVERVEERVRLQVEGKALTEREEQRKDIEELQAKMEQVAAAKEKVLEAKTKEVEVAHAEMERKEQEIAQLNQRVQEVVGQLEKMREKESQWCADILGGEERAKKLRKSLDELTIQATRAAVERTKAANERDKAVHEKRELEAKYDCLLEERIKLKDRLFNTDRLNSELCEQLKCANAKQAKECDATSGYGSEETRPSSPERAKAADRGDAHDCEQVDCENQELKRRLAHLKRTLEHTFNKLKTSNQVKEKVERDIQQQLIKTNNVLKLASKNIENRQN